MKEQRRDKVVESHDGKIENTELNTGGDERNREEIVLRNMNMQVLLLKE